MMLIKLWLNTEKQTLCHLMNSPRSSLFSWVLCRDLDLTHLIPWTLTLALNSPLGHFEPYLLSVESSFFPLWLRRHRNNWDKDKLRLCICGVGNLAGNRSNLWLGPMVEEYGKKPGSIRGRQGQTSFLDRIKCLIFLMVSCNSHFYCPGIPEIEGDLNTPSDLEHPVEWEKCWMAVQGSQGRAHLLPQSDLWETFPFFPFPSGLLIFQSCIKGFWLAELWDPVQPWYSELLWPGYCLYSVSCIQRALLDSQSCFKLENRDLRIHHFWEVLTLTMEAGTQALYTVISREARLLVRWDYFLAPEPHVMANVSM